LVLRVESLVLGRAHLIPLLAGPLLCGKAANRPYPQQG